MRKNIYTFFYFFLNWSNSKYIQVKGGLPLRTHLSLCKRTILSVCSLSFLEMCVLSSSTLSPWVTVSSSRLPVVDVMDKRMVERAAQTWALQHGDRLRMRLLKPSLHLLHMLNEKSATHGDQRRAQFLLPCSTGKTPRMLFLNEDQRISHKPQTAAAPLPACDRNCTTPSVKHLDAARTGSAH